MSDEMILFLDDMVLSEKKRGKKAAGDHFLCNRNESYTDFILCDGIGSGIKAGIAAGMCLSRIASLLNEGMSVRKTAGKLVSYMHGIRERDIPYSVFTIARILNDGNFFIAAYEMPEPFLLYPSGCGRINSRYYKKSNEIIMECTGKLLSGEALIMCSDGITQAGMGNGYPLGWTIDGVMEWINRKIQSGLSKEECMNGVFKKAEKISGGLLDDMTLAKLECRNAQELNLLTGPPADKTKDIGFTEDFFSRSGMKVVCGSSTMDMVSRITGSKIVMSSHGTFGKPPEYEMDGIDIAAEGAVTLNQVFNIIEDDRNNFDEKSIVTELCVALQDADIIRIFSGNALNKGHDSILFKQTGVLPRSVIIPILVEKLSSMGKIVSVVNP